MSFESFLRSLRSRRGPNRRPHRNRFAPRLEALDSRDVPATFLVTNLADAGLGSLRQAVLDANATPGADVIDFTVTGTISLTGDLLAITDGVAINGPGANLLTVERYSSNSTPVGIFEVGSAATVQLSGLTLTGSNAGAITNYGTLTISDSTLSGNSRAGAGGAIYSDGTLTVRHSTIAGNFADGYYTNDGFAYGGGIFVAGGTLTLSSSTVANNGAYGGAYYYVDPDSPYWPNGGVTIGQDAYGGGLYVAGGTVSIDHSTIAGNFAEGGWSGDPWFPYYSNGSGYGGGIYNGAGPDAVQIYNSILSDHYGTVTSLGHNLIGGSFGGTEYAASDLLNVDPRLGPLQDNGGPTPTMALLAGSPAFNAGDNTGAPEYDQRGAGFPRIFGDTIDIGAFEAQTPVLPTISITNVSLPEGNVGTTAALFTVQLSSASTETVTVSYSTADGSATVSDGDYQSTSGTLTFAPGETSKSIAVLINGDRRYETNESFVVNLTEATNAVVDDGQGWGFIMEDEPRVSLTSVSSSEGNTGTTPFVFTVTLSAASDAPLTIDYYTWNGTWDGAATAGSDYQAVSGTLTFAPGETSKTITVLVNGDRAGEPNEQFQLRLANPGSNELVTWASATILDDEPRISISDVTRQEGRKGKTTLFTFTISLSAAYDQPVTMSFRTANGTAKTSNSDYVAKSGTITFAPGETTKTITIEVKGDSKRESDEYFYLDLSGNSTNSWFTKNRGIGMILNDD